MGISSNRLATRSDKAEVSVQIRDAQYGTIAHLDRASVFDLIYTNYSMNEIESSNAIKDSGRVAQLDEHKPSKFADTGSSPVTVICDICGEVLKSKRAKANHIRWKHIYPNKDSASKEKSQKWLDAMASRKGKHLSKSKEICTCEFCGLEKEMTKDVFTRHKKYCKANPNAVPFPSHHQSEETKKKLSDIGLKNPYRRIMRKTQLYNGVLYDSNWEVELAKRLESLNEKFERPENPIKYIGSDGKEHNYFPDFYLPKRCVFVEVKNPYLFENDSKVQILKATRSDIIWLTSLEQIQSFK